MSHMLHKKYILECCTDSVESALNAHEGGADRLELCGNLVIGGTTPSLFLFEEIRKKSDIKIHVLIRPRFGDFLYTDYEKNIMKKEVEIESEKKEHHKYIPPKNHPWRKNMMLRN